MATFDLTTDDDYWDDSSLPDLADDFRTWLAELPAARRFIGRLAAPYDYAKASATLALRQRMATAVEKAAGALDDGTLIPLDFNDE